MLHHEESPDNINTTWQPPPHFALAPPPLFWQKFSNPPISIDFGKVNPPPLYEGGFTLAIRKD